MQENPRNIKANQIRDVLRYANKFRNATVVIYLDDEVIDSPLFLSHMQDIALIHQSGLKVVIVPGARRRIDQILSDSRISCRYQNGIRITEEDAMPLIKMAAFDVSNIVMTSLAAHQITATIGNWVRARSKGVIDGIDYGTAGEIDKLQTEAILNTLQSGFVPIFPCIGWNSSGKPYNISSVSLAKQIAINLKADKLFYLTKNAEITKDDFIISKKIGFSEFNDVPAMDLDELKIFLEDNKNTSQRNLKIISLLKAAGEACRNGVIRSHILNGSLEGALPCEIFSDLGSGTMIYSRDYGGLRPMQLQDIPAVLSVMSPFIQKKILLPRTSHDLEEKLSDYIVYEIDGCIRACAALHEYKDGQAEIAGIAVDENFSSLGIGPKLVDYFIDRSKKQNKASVFILTTRTSDWFEHLGFKPDTVESLPEERRALWTPERNSKVFRLNF
ncbi:MAG: amino-acid N-acetyltransferase [Treponema sp.]|nr:amino-acid N-acetyltransferase [Treponema sp.]